MKINTPLKKLTLPLLLLIPLALSAQEDSRYNAGMNLLFNDKAGDVNKKTKKVVETPHVQPKGGDVRPASAGELPK